MGYVRVRPKRLAEKLLHIRNVLGLSQSELHRKLGVEDSHSPDEDLQIRARRT